MNWRPGASLEALQQRAKLLQTLRAFFAQRGVLEVETPLLYAAPVTDPHIQALAVPHPCGANSSLWLQTSPEYAMKRLLAAGSGPIYQICKAVRRDEAGAKHNPEFTMLEWYRPQFSLEQLRDELVDLLTVVLGARPVQLISYKQAFQQYLGLDCDRTPVDMLQQCAAQFGDWPDNASRDDCLDFLFACGIEPHLGREVFSIVEGYPAKQAALAQTHRDAEGRTVATRFECYVDGVELANAYYELRDADEHRRRFELDLREREALGLPQVPIDEGLLAALDSGLPECSGIALGLDRLLMLCCGAGSIDEVLSFSLPRL